MSTVTQEQKKRYFEISALGVFLCVLVVFIHVASAPLNALDSKSWQYVAIMIPRRGFAFVVQGFIFLSGLKLFLSENKTFSYGKYLLKRFKHIILPYIIWVVIYYVYFAYYRRYFPFRIKDLLAYIYTGDLVSPFYYIIIIAQFYLLAPLWRRIIAAANPVILTAFSVMITVISWKYLPGVISALFPGSAFAYSDRVFTSYLIFWIAGCFAGRQYERFKKILHENRTLIRAGFVISLVFYLYLCYLRFSLLRNITFLDDVRIMYCMSAILFFFLAAVRLSGKAYGNTAPGNTAPGNTAPGNTAPGNIASRAIKMIHGADRISYSIYLAHCLVIFELDRILEIYADLPVKFSFPLRLLIVYAVTILASLLWNKLKSQAVKNA